MKHHIKGRQESLRQSFFWNNKKIYKRSNFM
jgi:hypothetical protein